MNNLKKLKVLEVVDILKKAHKSYLWDKQYNTWNDTDYKNLQLIIENRFNDKVRGNKRKTITILTPTGDYYTFNTYKECCKYIGCKQPVLSIAVKKGYKIKGYKII